MPAQPTDLTAPTPGPAGPAAAPGPCASRRQVLRAAGVVSVVPAGLLSACGAAEPEAEVATDGTVTVPAADTPVGGATYYADPKIVVTHPVDGDYRAFDATCPHQGCSTSSFEDGVLVCPCHGSRFDPGTGDVVGGPAESGLTALGASLDGDDVVVVRG